MALTPADAEFATQLNSLVPDVATPIEPRYVEEPRGVFHGSARFVARPRTAQDVAEILRAANAAGVGVIPYSGGTGLVGGQVQDAGPASLVLSLERMSAIREVSADDQTMIAEAGTILADAQAAAEAVGLLYPLSLASEGSCRIGGNLATNAGGVNVLRWGNARDLCLGVEAVLADGTIIQNLKALRKDNTGFDLRHLLIGSEGTLAVITAARLRLFPRPTETCTALLHVPDPDAALQVLRQMQGIFGECVSAFELISHVGVGFVADTLPDLDLPDVGGAEWMVLLDLGSGPGSDLNARTESILAGLMDQGLVTGGTLAQSEAQRAVIWGMRESIPEGNKRVGAIASHDISVPVSRIPAFIEDAAKRVARIEDALRINCFGHMGDGNLHYNLFPPLGRSKAEFAGQKPLITRAIHDLVHDYGGSISAEHGIGRLKRDDLVRYGDPGKLAAMKAIKKALDPRGILNPGAVL